MSKAVMLSIRAAIVGCGARIADQSGLRKLNALIKEYKTVYDVGGNDSG